MTIDHKEVWLELARRGIEYVDQIEGRSAHEVALRHSRQLVCHALDMAGVACPSCHGQGQRTYSSGSTWRGGMGTAAFTEDVCDICWGTGRTDKTGVNLRAIRDRQDQDQTRAFAEELGRQLGANMESVQRGLPLLAKKLRGVRGLDFWASRTADHLANILDELAAVGEESDE